ncbi:zinc ribbon domain-containing protein [Leifsonia bigeumensis]|uniref:Zinc ribbon domain-containing protein n=1 Tax=Leifsonella bigeumensis TaxID=433643 RepID=A0ABP7FHA1_9MICO|nr:FmdB family zinc ribbon protein [Terrimesophilobacter sp.]
MPTYSYRCTECGTAFDIHQAFSDATLTVCPTCGGALRKVFSPVGVSFNGSGFYRNDSRAKPASAGGGEKSSGDRSGTDTKTEKAPPATKEKAASTPGTGSGTGKAATSSAAPATS